MKRIKFTVFLISFLMSVSLHLSAQRAKSNAAHTIKWTGVKSLNVNETDSIHFISFEGAAYAKNLPYYYENIKAEGAYTYTVSLINTVYKACTDAETKLLAGIKIHGNIVVKAAVEYERKQPWLCVSFLPLRRNATTGAIEELVSFDFNITHDQNKIKPPKTKVYAANSVLATGNWFKIAVRDDGVYKLTYDDLISLGINPGSIDPRNIRIYGNGGGMLPEDNFVPRYDDLQENAIYVAGEADGVFDKSDYILFYGQSPIRWSLGNDNKFHHQQNYYTNYTCYFITADLGKGKRITSQASSTLPATNIITKFDDYACHELDTVNLIKSGKEWYGENFDILTSFTFPFSFPNIDAPSGVSLITDIAGCYTSDSYYNINADGHTQTLTLLPCQGQYVHATEASTTLNFTPSSGNINVTVIKNTANAVGWLNYLELNVVRNLTLAGSQMSFRSKSSIGAGNVSDFTVTNLGAGARIWDVTHPLNCKEQIFTTAGSNGDFRIATDSLREFVTFNPGGYLSPVKIGKVANQNLHALGQADLIIIAYPDFVSEANRIGEIHSANDNLTYIVATPSDIYNEFSSGVQDVAALRDFVKMFYDRATTEAEMPKYLLLFGDASYDYKNRLPNNTNYVPTFESPVGIEETSSYATDDFFGLLDDNEGPYVDALLDIGIGRFPVKTTDDANDMVNKVNAYLAKSNPNVITNGCTAYSATVSGDWRNMVCFVADDEEGGSFVSYSEELATLVDTAYNNYNIDKIYCDAYVQQTGSGGQRYPEVNAAINSRVQQGALIINYIGHGGEVGWALERILQISDINSWTNLYNMPLFVTATCEFSRYDDPEQTSAGEMVLLNTNGGGIALLTTSRVSYSVSNQTLNTKFFENVFMKVNGKYPTLGELCSISKNGPTTIDEAVRNFVLLGDPALRLSYPVNKVVTTMVNGHAALSKIDTIKAFQKVTIAGEIRDPSNNKLTTFNGIVYPTVYDKKSIATTLGNDPTSPIMNFLIQKSILYKGKVSATNGNFSFSFIVPKDIAYNYGIGRISYYAEDATTNAQGYYENDHFKIGGSDTGVIKNKKGPDIRLFMNDTTFVFGGMTNEKPLLLAYVSDSGGINTVGNGIGHDITAVLDGNTTNSINLNDFYEANLNSYQKGTIHYPFSSLTNGRHTLKLKVWDIYNNSSEAYTEFVVSQSANLALDHVLNYPNPFTTHTEFYFEHNQPCCTLDVQIQIFTITGKLVKTIQQTVETIGFRAAPIAWDGLDDYGDPIARGVYIYKVKAKGNNGSLAQKIEKLVILR